MKTLDEDSAALGISCNEVLALRRDQPWTSHWSARYDAGEEHLRVGLATPGRRADLSRLAIEGPQAFAHAVRAVVTRFPAVVQCYLVDHVTFVHVPDLDVSGRCDSRGPVRIEIRSAQPAPKTVGHECAHAFHASPSLMTISLDAAERERLYETICLLDVEGGLVDEHERMTMQNERAADALASLWLGYTVDTTSGRLGENRRHRLRHQVAEAAERARARAEKA